MIPEVLKVNRFLLKVYGKRRNELRYKARVPKNILNLFLENIVIQQFCQSTMLTLGRILQTNKEEYVYVGRWILDK